MKPIKASICRALPHCARIHACDNSGAIILKDELGNPKGTMVKGPVAKEACERWPAISKISSLIV